MRRLIAVLAGLLAGVAGSWWVPAVAADPRPAQRVTAVRETPALFDDVAGGDADADDPAIWVNARRPRNSLVLATAKTGGLRVYDLAGREVQAIGTPVPPRPGDAAGRFNNVDLLGGIRLGGRRVDLAAVTDRGRDRLRFYRIDPARRVPLVDVTAPAVPYAFSTDDDDVNRQTTAYGLATWVGADGVGYAAASRRSTSTLALFRLAVVGGTVTYRKLDTLVLPQRFRLPDGTGWTPCTDPGDGPQVEGMTFDAAAGTLYAAQEDVGVWRIKVDNGRFAGRPRILEHVREYGVPWSYDVDEEECVIDNANDPGFGGRIAADVEGLTILPTGRRAGTLVVSSQGGDTFYTYDRRTNRPLRRFAIADGPAIDGVQECDGAAVTATPLPGFPGGLLVVHDGQNTPDVPGDDGEPRPNTNFKYLDAAFLRQH
jgi:3-phytase